MSSRASRVLCVVFAGACSLIQEPRAVLGTRYVLRSIEGAALPARFSMNQLLTAVITSDTLELRDDGIGTLREAAFEPETSRESRHDTELAFVRSGNRISVTMRCAIAAACIRPPHLVGTVLENGIVFTESAVSRAPLVFDRIQ